MGESESSLGHVDGALGSLPPFVTGPMDPVRGEYVCGGDGVEALRFVLTDVAGVGTALLCDRVDVSVDTLRQEDGPQGVGVEAGFHFEPGGPQKYRPETDTYS